MARKRPTLHDVQKLYPSDMSRCAGYTWHLGTRIGKGSFGEVYLGWTQDGKQEVAVKAVSKSFFKQDPKVKENLDREIRIMKLLKNCEYVVRLEHVQEMRQHIVLVMELCDYDLDHLVKNSPFREDDITLFLFQLSNGMKALREQNIVHRDLKPGNILIKKDPNTGKIKIKLADFGFARHFTEEGTKKPIDMQSLAGTPVFMAPEALRCVFYPGEHYDDKVDIWSIGALLYKVIVGHCGFYAQLQDIPKILKHKKEAIAFEKHSGGKVRYIEELPPSVYDRLSVEYRAKMNTLLKSLLKLDPQERMSFPEFFEFVDDLVNSKIEIVNLLYGTTGKIMFEKGMKMEQLRRDISTQLGVREDHQLVFSSSSPHYLYPKSRLSPDNFTQLVDDCGALKGKGVLYLLPINILVGGNPSNLSCLAQLKFAVRDQHRCVELITDHKLSNEIVRELHLLKTQLMRQESGVKEFRKFCLQSSQGSHVKEYQQMTRRATEVSARVSMAVEWLTSDLNTLQLQNIPAQRALESLKQMKNEIGQIVLELDTLYTAFIQPPPPPAGREVGVQLEKEMADLTKIAKLLPEMRKVEMFGRCQSILMKCEQMAQTIGQSTQQNLSELFKGISSGWKMLETLHHLAKLCHNAEEMLNKQIPQIRDSVLSSVSSRRDVPLSSPSSGFPPPVVVTPPGWPRPPPPSSPYQPSPLATPPPVSENASELSSLRNERDHYESLFNDKVKECMELVQTNNFLKEQMGGQRRRTGSSQCEEEKTLGPGTTLLRPDSQTENHSLTHSLTPDDHKLLDGLREQLKSFCTIADRIKTPTDKPRSQTARSPTLYPSIRDGSPNLEEYSIITMTPERSEGGVATNMSSPDSVEQLIPQANQLMSALRDGLKELGHSLAVENSVSGERAFVKIARPSEYITGDLVLFNPIRLPESKTTVPIILHAEKPAPFLFMEPVSYAGFGIKPGRVPDLIVGKLLERPRLFKFEDDAEMKKEFKDIKGEFYRVKAEPTPFKFFQSKAPPRPPLPATRSRLFGGSRS